MAKRNFTMQEMIEILDKGEDFEAISYMGRVFPLPMFAVMQALREGNGIVGLSKYFPEYLTATKLQRQMKAELLGDVEDDGDEDEDAEEEQPKAKAKKAPAKKATAKKAAPKKKAPEPEPEDDDEDDDAGEDEGSEYAGKPATELYKLCKKRGIKAAPRKSAKFYADLLEQADAKAADAEDEDDEDDDWDI